MTAGRVLLSIKLTARLAGVTPAAVRAAIRRGRLDATTLAEAERTSVRAVDLHDAGRYYGWPPALVDRLEDEMRAGVPEEQDVYKVDDGPADDHPADDHREPAEVNLAPEARLKSPEHTRGHGSGRDSRLERHPTAAEDAWKRAARMLAAQGQMPNDAPPGFKLILPRRQATLQRRDVYDLVVDGELVGTIADSGFAAHVREKCRMGEVFVDGRGAVKWRPRLPLPEDA